MLYEVITTKSWRRLDGDRFGPTLIVTTVLTQAIVFAASDRVWPIDSPRFILPLWWAMAMAIGFAVRRLWRKRRVAVLIALAVLVVRNNFV